MRLEGPGKRLTIYVGESDRHGHTPLATEIVQRAHAAGLAGATVLRGIEGYGRSNHIHRTRFLALSDDLPMCVVIVDDASRIEAFLPELDELVTGGLVMIDDVEVIKYVGGPDQLAGDATAWRPAAEEAGDTARGSELDR